MTLQFAKATKERAKLKLAIFGPSGAGKTFTSLRIATGIGGKIAVIDTERGSASKYADRFEFDVLELPTTDIDTYIAGIQAASAAGYEILIIDSLSHGWFDLIDEVDKIAKAKYRGNTWSAWSEGTPKQRRFVNAIINLNAHMIATMRTKTEWVVENKKPIRVGTAPQQGKGIEYEFDILMELSPEHVANISKDRTGKFQDRMIDKPGEDFGAELAAWLTDGATPTQRKSPEREEPAVTEKALIKAALEASNGKLPPNWLHLADIKLENPDLEVMNWREFADAVVTDKGLLYNARKHVTNALKKELGADWHKIVNRTQAWALLAERKAD